VSSERQIESNKLNARLSTGPRTIAGKQKIATNALKHGLTGKQIVLPDENPDDFDEFSSTLWQDLDPQGTLEELLVEKIVADAWRLRRFPRLEAACTNLMSGPGSSRHRGRHPKTSRQRECGRLDGQN
jgi:hypothetical protein